MKTNSQSDISSTWDPKATVLVSIVCAAYNQEQYIGDALEGFLAQQTDFPFEIIVHDDASTDRTAEIIQSYASKYPAIVKPILQKENQFSKGGFKPSIYAAGFAKGKYIALCEGDDYWICNEKLQLQVDALERNPAVEFSFHSAVLLREGRSEQPIYWQYENDRIITLTELITRHTDSFAPTASYMFRHSLMATLPDWFNSRAPVGDFFLERYGARIGGALYIDKPMSVYREMTPGSWNDRTQKDTEAYRNHVDAMLDCLQLMTPDFPDHAHLLRLHGSKLALICSLRELFAGQNESFLQHIEISAAKHKFFSKKQKLAYYLRHWPALLRAILKARRSPPI